MTDPAAPEGAAPTDGPAPSADTPAASPDDPVAASAPPPDDTATPARADASSGVPSDPAASPQAAGSEASRYRPLPRLLRPLIPLARAIDRVPHPPWNTWQGMLLLFVVIGGFGSVATMAGAKAVGVSETASFCTTCHTMEPQQKAYAVSPHKDVGCGECHVDPGLIGFVKAKAGGTKELYALVTKTYPTPITPPEHSDLPPVQHTCMECHSIDQITKNGGPTKLIVRPIYATDESNTRQTISVLLRPVDLGPTGGNRGVHWHVQEKVTYTSEDEQDQKIDLVESTTPDGQTQQFIASGQVRVSADVGKDVARLKGTENNRTMDCISCHNRVGHEVPNVDEAVDDAMAAGKIDATLPYIKRDGVKVVSGTYPSVADADKAIDAIATGLQTHYPLVAKNQKAQISAAVTELKSIYNLVATPGMGVSATTYADNLGHQSSPGCFRCHDGAHYLIKGGQVTNEVIPSTCDTCHTFPQTGVSPSNIPIGVKPTNHDDALWAFDHKAATNNVLPDAGSCGACHAPSYCENCHDSGAIKVDHATMLYNHAQAITAAGGPNACAYCHQTAYCAQCHKDQVLGSSKAALGVQSGSGP